MKSSANFENTLGYLIATLSKLHRGMIGDGLLKIGLYLGQEMIIHYLSTKGPMNQKTLSSLLMVSSPTLTTVLQRMEKGKLLKKTHDPTDKRNKIIQLTEKGEDLVTEIHKQWMDVEDKVIQGLSIEEKILLHRLLGQVILNLQQTE